MNQPQPLISNGEAILNRFDVTDESNIGKPFYWDEDKHLTTVEMLICSDEIEMAFKLLDMVPAWYRDNYPEKLAEIKKILFQNLYDQYDYASDFDEANYTYEGCLEQYKNGYFFPRADILKTEILKLNEAGEVPWIYELSPSHGAMILGILNEGFKVNFYGKNLNAPALNKLKSWLPDGVWQDRPQANQKKILVNFESIEHMSREKDLEQAAFKDGYEFDMIFISAPYGCLFHGLPNWRNRRLGHVRGYTVKELLNLIASFFPKYDYTVYKTHSIVIKGTKK